MNLKHRSKKLLITGKSGSGKSTYFTEYVLSVFNQPYSRICCYDHQGEFAARTGIAPCFTPEQMAEAWQTGWVIFDPSVLFPGQVIEAWNFFCEWTFERALHSPAELKLLAVDELQIFSSTSDLSWEQSLVVETGRKYGLDFCGICQQMNLIHNRMRNQLTEIVTFAQTDPYILKDLEIRGFNPGIVQTLQPGDYIDRNLQTGSETSGNILVEVYGSSAKLKQNISPPDSRVCDEGEDESSN